MPDFERVVRSLETELATTPEQKAYVAGKHHGLDRARKEIGIVAIVIASIFSLLFLVTH